MRAAFRVDASYEMGTGHLMRCLILANELQLRGSSIHIICRDHSRNIINQLNRFGMSVSTLPDKKGLDDKLHSDIYANWLGVSQHTDADQTIDVLRTEKVDWLIVDHYSLDANWERRVRSYVKNIMVIDDLENRAHECDILLDQNYSDKNGERYNGLTLSETQLLIGPHYALLHPEYLKYRKKLYKRNGEIQRVLVYFGGSDQFDLTSLTLRVLSRSEFRHLIVDVVVGINNQHYHLIQRLSSSRKFTNLYRHEPHLANLLAQADLAIGAGGSTTWERMCLGAPSIVISVAENQKKLSESLSRSKFIWYLGFAENLKEDNLINALVSCMSKPRNVAKVSIQNQLLVDARGTQRVAEVLDPTPMHQLKLRPACESDIVSYFDWANDFEVRKQSINSEPISWSTHQKWFKKKLSDPESHLFILEGRTLPLGQIRLDKEGDEVKIDYSIDPIARGRGRGKYLIKSGIEISQAMGVKKIRADVKLENSASRSIFTQLGFKENLNPTTLPNCISFYLGESQ